jgi:hypothetical protein
METSLRYNYYPSEVRTGILETCTEVSINLSCYQSTANFIKVETGDLLANPHSILKRPKNNFCQLFNANGVCEEIQAYIQLSL